MDTARDHRRFTYVFGAVATDPFENFRRQNAELINQVLAARMQALLAPHQDAIARAVAGPLAQLQEHAARAIAPPVAALLEQYQPVLQAAIRGPILAAAEASQPLIRKALEGPLQQLQQHQEAMALALAGPFAAIAQNQDLMRAVMEAAASAADSEPDVDASDLTDPEQIAWLEQWSAAIAEWTPTWEQVEVFLTALALLLGMVVYAAGQTDTEVAQALLEPAGLLCAAGALLINRVRHYRRS